MILIVSGAVVMGLAWGLLWYLKPRDGKPHRLATTPILESLIPIAITAGTAVGIALIVSGVIQ